MSIKTLQKNLGVVVDGIAGAKTYTALYRKLGAKSDIANILGTISPEKFQQYEMTTDLRMVHFLAQLVHESGSFRYVEEIASGKAYEGRKDLGNTQAGDGVRYKGRGWIQLTGRANYKKYGKLIGYDLETKPEMAAEPDIALHIALEYWKQNNLNPLADKDNILSITKRINGGTNGLSDRKIQLVKIKGWFQ